MKAAPIRQGIDASAQTLVVERQAGVQAEAAPQTRMGGRCAQEAQILGNAGPHLLHAIAVGHFIRQNGAQTGAIDRLADDIEAAGDEVGAGVMVNEAGRPVFDGVHEANQGAGADALAVQGFIQGPPQTLQYLGEVARRRARYRQAASVSAIKVRMRADAAGHDILAARVDDFGRRMPGLQFGVAADGAYALAVDEQGRIGQNSRLGAQGDQIGVNN